MEHYYKSVSGWGCFVKLYAQMVERAPADKASTFVEVGSWLGRSAAFMGVEIINTAKDITLHCVDPWIDGGPDLRNTKYYKELRSPPFDQFLANTAPVSRVLTAHQMPSVEAAPLFADHSVDFIMLDGDHNYDGIRADIDAWMPKMARGSIISGDDYMWPGVKQAVDETFGKRAQITHIKRDANYLKSASYWVVQL